jgi:hypothetical protein
MKENYVQLSTKYMQNKVTDYRKKCKGIMENYDRNKYINKKRKEGGKKRK